VTADERFYAPPPDQMIVATRMTRYGWPKPYRVMRAAMPFDQAEAHVQLGGRLVALEDGCVVAVFDHQFGPSFEILWSHVTWHAIVEGV